MFNEARDSRYSSEDFKGVLESQAILFYNLITWRSLILQGSMSANKFPDFPYGSLLYSQIFSYFSLQV